MAPNVVVAFAILFSQIAVYRTAAQCCQSTSDWKLVFKGTAGVGGNLYDLFLSDGGLNENVAGAQALTNGFKGHYKNRLMDKWEAIGVTEVKFALYTGGVEKASLLFNGIGSDKVNWFSTGRLRQSPWQDLMNTRLHNGQDGQFFSVAGEITASRRFYINNNYGGCENDAGWLAVIDDGHTVCAWSDSRPKPYFIYASDSMVNYERGNPQFADVFAIFIKHQFDYIENGQDWELVFKAVSGSGGNVLNLWNSDGGRNEDNERAKDLSSYFRDHYKNSIIDHWSAIGVKQVKVAIYDECREVMYMTFNGEGSDKNNWFSKGRLTSTSYTDLDPNSQTNYFSIPGHDPFSRHFFVNRSYGGCGNDIGWLVVVDDGNTACDWSEMKRKPYFLYGSAGHTINYGSGSDDVATGGVFAVFIKT
ncbi:uncharacterized protein [Ptychodera flava]|uniref:uncharacterized protein n=1 Tax=Ptychodera flava TaxID=63121 RepID=UPI00396A46B6